MALPVLRRPLCVATAICLTMAMTPSVLADDPSPPSGSVTLRSKEGAKTQIEITITFGPPVADPKTGALQYPVLLSGTIDGIVLKPAGGRATVDHDGVWHASWHDVRADPDKGFPSRRWRVALKIEEGKINNDDEDDGGWVTGLRNHPPNGAQRVYY